MIWYHVTVEDFMLNMETLDVIHRRRAIRRFKNTPISDENLKLIMSAGMTAPSAMNRQSWRLIVVNDLSVKKQLANISTYANMVVEAPIAIFLCGDEKASYDNHWIFDCSACAQNMLLAACALGIGSLWTGVNEDKLDEYRDLFGLPKTVVPHSLLIFGYSDIPFEKRDYFDGSKVHYNKW